MLKIATTIIQNFPKKISCEDVVKKVSSRSLIDMEPRALQGIAAQKEIFVQKKKEISKFKTKHLLTNKTIKNKNIEKWQRIFN